VERRGGRPPACLGAAALGAIADMREIERRENGGRMESSVIIDSPGGGALV